MCWGIGTSSSVPLAFDYCRASPSFAAKVTTIGLDPLRGRLVTYACCVVYEVRYRGISLPRAGKGLERPFIEIGYSAKHAKRIRGYRTFLGNLLPEGGRVVSVRVL
jgi:hypothetical protein